MTQKESFEESGVPKIPGRGLICERQKCIPSNVGVSFQPWRLDYRLWAMVALLLLSLLPFLQDSILALKSWALPAPLGLGL